MLVFKLLNPTRCYDGGGGEDGDIKEAAGGLHSDTRRGETSRRFKVKSDPGEILDACVQIKQTLCQRSGLSGPSIIGRGEIIRPMFFNARFQRCKVTGSSSVFLQANVEVAY